MNANTEILPVDEPATGLVPADLMRAITSGADPAVITKLMDLHDRWEANRARKAFAAAMAAAKAEIPVITKSREVDFTSNRGRTHYRYEDLADIADTVDPILSKFGLSYRYRTAALSATTIAVTCIVEHRDGHSEETTLPGVHDASGNKNANQAIGSAVTYLQRYTLKAALGLAAAADDDGQGAGDPPADRAAPPARPTGETADEYCARWERLLEQGSEPAAIGWQWNSELEQRRGIFRKDPDRERSLKDAVTKRCRELVDAIAAADADPRELEPVDAEPTQDRLV